MSLFRSLDERAGPSRREWTIDGLLEDAGSLLLVAEEKRGKSAIACEAVRAVVSGDPFFGMAAKGGLALYIAGEKQRETAFRLRALLPPDVRSRVRLSGRIDLTEESVLALVAKEAAEFRRATADDLRLIVVDVASTVMGDGDENATRDANRLTAGLDFLRAKTGAAVLLVHHARRAAPNVRGVEGRSRGSQVFPAWAETTAIIDRMKGGGCRLRSQSSNIGPDDRIDVAFRIESRAIDPDDPSAGSVAIAVALAAEVERARPADARPARQRSLGKNQVDALSGLDFLTPDGSPVPLDDWRQECEKRWNKPNPGAARQAWLELLDPEKSRLLRDGLIIIEGNFVRRQETSGNVRFASGNAQRQASGNAGPP